MKTGILGSGNRCVKYSYEAAVGLKRTPIMLSEMNAFLAYIGERTIDITLLEEPHAWMWGSASFSGRWIKLWPLGQNVWVFLHELSHIMEAAEVLESPATSYGGFEYTRYRRMTHGKKFARMFELILEIWEDYINGKV